MIIGFGSSTPVVKPMLRRTVGERAPMCCVVVVTCSLFFQLPNQHRPQQSSQSPQPLVERDRQIHRRKSDSGPGAAADTCRHGPRKQWRRLWRAQAWPLIRAISRPLFVPSAARTQRRALFVLLFVVGSFRGGHEADWVGVVQQDPFLLRRLVAREESGPRRHQWEIRCESETARHARLHH